MYAQANRGVSKQYVSANGNVADEVLWQYAYTGANPFLDGTYDPYVLSTTAPDNSLTKTYLYRDNLIGGFGFSTDQPRAGMPYDERIYGALDAGGVRRLLRRKLTEWGVTGSNANSSFPSAQQTARRNPRVTKEVAIIFEPGGSALATTTIHEYDPAYEFSTGVNETAINEYDFVTLDPTAAETVAIGSVPLGALLRRTEKTYLDDNAQYRDLNILGMETSSTVYKGLATDSNVVSRRTIGYDETSLLPYSPPSTWTDPGNYRGNVTTISHWVNFDGSTLSVFPQGTYDVSHAQYDQFGNVRTKTDAKGDQSQIDYSPAYNYAYPTTVSSAVPDPSGQHGSMSPLIASTAFELSSGRILSTTDVNNKTTNFAYSDALNGLKQITAPDGGRVRYNYSDTPSDLYVQTLSDVDPSRTLETRQYLDGLGRSIRSFLYEATGSLPWLVTDIYYDNMGRLSKTSNPYRVASANGVLPATCSVCTSNGFDPLGRLLTATTPDNAQAIMSYGVDTSGTFGTTNTVTDQAGKRRRSLTDALGRMVRVDEPNKATGDLDIGGASTFYTYDLLGNLRKVSQGAQERFFLYDSLGRLLRVKNPEQQAGSQASGLVDALTGNNQWSMAYGYDSNGNLTSRVDSRNITTSYFNDALNRPITRSYSNDWSPAVNYYYDNAALPSGAPVNFDRGYALGRLVAVTYGTGSSNGNYDGYDQMGRVIRQVQQTGGVNYLTEATYYLNSALETETYPAVPNAIDRRTVSYSLDAAARVLSLSSPATSYAGAASVSNIGYAPHGAPTTETYGNSLIHSVAYNTRLQPFEIKLGGSGSPSSLLDITYNYGTTANNGNVQSIAYSGGGWSGTQSFTYDSLNRLATATETTGSSTNWSETNGYDQFGNRWIVNAGGTPSDTFNGHNQIVGQSYDAAGNLVGTNPVSSYDAENRLVSVNYFLPRWSAPAAGWTGWRFGAVYDGEGQRVSKDGSTGTTWSETDQQYIYDMFGRLIIEFKSGGGDAFDLEGGGGTDSSKEYIYGSSGIVASVEPTNGTRYLTPDHLGSPRVVTSATAAVVSRQDYKPFGEELYLGIGGRTAEWGMSPLNQKFTQKERDIETGLDYFLARYYSSAQGRFTSVDPENAEASHDYSDPQSWNGYSYVKNNPCSNIDPDGRCICLFERLKNAAYGFKSNEQVQQLEDKWRNYLREKQQQYGNLVFNGSDGKPVIVDPNAISRDQVFHYAASFREAEYYGNLTTYSPEQVDQMSGNQLPSAPQVPLALPTGSFNTVGQNLKNLRDIGSGRLRGFSRGNTELTGGGQAAKETFKQLTGRDPAGSFDRVVQGTREVVYRASSGSGVAKIEIVDKAQKFVEKISFRP
jgi:RHS repeat-associated protein